MANVFLTSDTHFGHRNIMKFEPIARPFHYIQEHDEYLIEQWNNTVGVNDVVWHLGDVLFGKHNFPILDRLNGTKHLILGNHDRFDMSLYAEYFKKIKSSWKMDDLLMTHIPIHPNQFYRFDGNIHGHLHSAIVKEPDSRPDFRYYNVCVEHTDLKPIPFEEVRKALK